MLRRRAPVPPVHARLHRTAFTEPPAWRNHPSGHEFDSRTGENEDTDDTDTTNTVSSTSSEDDDDIEYESERHPSAPLPLPSTEDLRVHEQTLRFLDMYDVIRFGPVRVRALLRGRKVNLWPDEPHVPRRRPVQHWDQPWVLRRVVESILLPGSIALPNVYPVSRRSQQPESVHRLCAFWANHLRATPMELWQESFDPPEGEGTTDPEIDHWVEFGCVMLPRLTDADIDYLLWCLDDAWALGWYHACEDLLSVCWRPRRHQPPPTRQPGERNQFH